ncbi:signal peptidase II [Martelella alba]|uniref:Lipoprotein signal peptidase n=1 Tax=Martelella alba TaxID=2590451 RepID=A0A506U866_9HYPH|nr:signal peptidase II [Martelella alba]TPW28067.1 signal peptidase II [Martelella alba]
MKVSPLSRLPVAILFVFVAVALDQMIKAAVEYFLPFHRAVEVLPFLALYRTYNLGIAFSMFSDANGYLIVGARIIIVAFVSWFWWRSDARRSLLQLGLALIVSGALGNIIDRFVYGHVIDYVLFHVGNWSFAVFNLADSFITIGAVLVFLDEFLLGLSGKKNAKEES